MILELGNYGKHVNKNKCKYFFRTLSNNCNGKRNGEVSVLENIENFELLIAAIFRKAANFLRKNSILVALHVASDTFPSKFDFNSDSLVVLTNLRGVFRILPSI